MFEVTIRSPMYVPSVASSPHRNSISQFNFARNSQGGCDPSRYSSGLLPDPSLSHVLQIMDPTGSNPNQNQPVATFSSNIDGRVSIDMADSAPLPSPTMLQYPQINQFRSQITRYAYKPTIDEITLPESQNGVEPTSAHQIPRPQTNSLKVIRPTEIFHYARIYRQLSTKGLLNLTIQEICKMAFIHKLLSRYVVKRRASTASRHSADGSGTSNEFTLGSAKFEVIGEKQQGFFARLRGYLYDWWASIFLKEDFGAVYYNDWRYINIKVGR